MTQSSAEPLPHTGINRGEKEREHKWSKHPGKNTPVVKEEEKKKRQHKVVIADVAGVSENFEELICKRKIVITKNIFH